MIYDVEADAVLVVGVDARVELTGAGLLLPRCETAPAAVLIVMAAGIPSEAGGAHCGHSLFHLSAVDSTALKTCRLGGIVKRQRTVEAAFGGVLRTVCNDERRGKQRGAASGERPLARVNDECRKLRYGG